MGGKRKGFKIINVIVFGNLKIINKGKRRGNVRKGNRILNYCILGVEIFYTCNDFHLIEGE